MTRRPSPLGLVRIEALHYYVHDLERSRRFYTERLDFAEVVIFYVRGGFTSRRGVGPGSISHHPAGVMHGPHPGAYEGSIGARETSELAVMLDCTRPLEAARDALAVEDPGYEASFVS